MMEIARSRTFAVRRLTLPPYDANAYIVQCLTSGKSGLIDAPGRADLLAAALAATRPHVFLLTHGHADHTGALRALRSKLGVPIAVHAGDADSLPVPYEILLDDGDTVRIGRLALIVIHTPGHTPGSLCFRIDNVLFSGDTLFPGGPGRTDTPGDFHRILKSIQKRLLPLPDATEVFPGHGPPTTIGVSRDEIAEFFGRRHPPNLCGDVIWRQS